MPKKIFELAKELNMGPLDLVEDLRSKGIVVRNHMTELSDSELAKIMPLYDSAGADSESKNAKKVVKKKIVKKKSNEESVESTQLLADDEVVDKSEKNDRLDRSDKHDKSDTVKKKSLVRKKNDTSKESDESFVGAGDDSLDKGRDGTCDEINAEENSSGIAVENNLREETFNNELSQDSSSENTASVDEVVKQAALSDDKKKTAITGLRVVSIPRTVTVNKSSPAGGTSVKNVETVGGTAEHHPSKVEVRKKADLHDSNEVKLYTGDMPQRKHRFTPVYIPPKKDDLSKDSLDLKLKKESHIVSIDELKDEDSDNPNSKHKKNIVKKETGKADYFDEEETLDIKDKASKKRIGGLATMMSGRPSKIPGIGKVKDIELFRAEDELKAYSTLSISGKPIYSQVQRKKNFSGTAAKTMITEVKESKRVITVHRGCYASDMAQKLSIKFRELADSALDINLLLKEDDYLGFTLCSEVAALFKYRVEDRAFDETKIINTNSASAEEKKVSKDNLPSRNPIITIMGHVDHGKTSLLDYIRKEKVAQGEAGGITQHIGAYSVKVNDKTLTFLDTPGHAAFASMRQRGADVTDIVVLVVAADDGVMPQTKESIRFCQQAKVPIIVAVNKIDKEGVNPEKIKHELGEFNIIPEEWGGDTQFVHVSALKGTGVDDLLESIALLAEVLDLRAEKKGAAEGVVIESKIEQGRGPVATILVQKGTLFKGDAIVVGETFGRARSLTDHTGKLLQEAPPSTPIQILGLDNPPSPGDILNVVKNEKEAKRIADHRIDERKKLENAPERKKVTLEDFFSAGSADSEGVKSLNLIIRSDVQGSYEAIKQAIEGLQNTEVQAKVIGGGVGPINDNDVMLAASSNGFIIGFNMRPVTSARKLAEEKGIDVKTYSIIYELINDVKLAIEGLLEPETVEEFIGRAEVKETFVVPKIGTIAGSMVVDGKIQRGCSIRLLRNGKIVFDGKLSSLKRFKDDVKEVSSGYECGIGLENFNDLKIDDIFEAYLKIEKKRTLEDITHM